MLTDGHVRVRPGDKILKVLVAIIRDDVQKGVFGRVFIKRKVDF